MFRQKLEVAPSDFCLIHEEPGELIAVPEWPVTEGHRERRIDAHAHSLPAVGYVALTGRFRSGVIALTGLHSREC
jgi:hypothetical protein